MKCSLSNTNLEPSSLNNNPFLCVDKYKALNKGLFSADSPHLNFDEDKSGGKLIKAVRTLSKQ